MDNYGEAVWCSYRHRPLLYTGRFEKLSLPMLTKPNEAIVMCHRHDWKLALAVATAAYCRVLLHAERVE